jgi:hypothetical protein
MMVVLRREDVGRKELGRYLELLAAREMRKQQQQS